MLGIGLQRWLGYVRKVMLGLCLWLGYVRKVRLGFFCQKSKATTRTTVSSKYIFLNQVEFVNMSFINIGLSMLPKANEKLQLFEVTT